ILRGFWFRHRSGIRIITQHPTNNVDAALEANCAVLIMLESLRARAAQPRFDVAIADQDLSAAINALRQAIAHLRSSRRFGATMLTLGLVLGASPPVAGELGEAAAYRMDRGLDPAG